MRSASAESATAHAARSAAVSVSSFTSRSRPTSPGRAVQQHGVAGGVDQRFVLVDGHHVGLEAQPRHRQPVRRPRQHEGPAPVDHPLQVGDLLGALGGVAPVGAEPAGGVAVDVQQQRGVGAGEPGEVPDVHQIRDQQRLDVGGAQQPAQCRAAGGVGHAREPTAATPPPSPAPAGRAAAGVRRAAPRYPSSAWASSSRAASSPSGPGSARRACAAAARSREISWRPCAARAT